MKILILLLALVVFCLFCGVKLWLFHQKTKMERAMTPKWVPFQAPIKISQDDCNWDTYGHFKKDTKQRVLCRTCGRPVSAGMFPFEWDCSWRDPERGIPGCIDGVVLEIME